MIGNAADVYPELVQRGITPDVVTDQTPAHDVYDYVPHGLTLEDANQLRENDREEGEEVEGGIKAMSCGVQMTTASMSFRSSNFL